MVVSSAYGLLIAFLALYAYATFLAAGTFHFLVEGVSWVFPSEPWFLLFAVVGLAQAPVRFA